MQGLRFGPLAPNTAHLCIDMQRVFLGGTAWASPWTARILPTVTQLVAAAPDHTVFTRFMPPLEPQDMPGMWQRYYARWHALTRARAGDAVFELIDELQPWVPPARMMDKTRYSAFSSPALLGWLRDHRIEGLVLSGAETDVCILATVLSAVDLGYRVTIASDAVCSSSDPGHEALLSLYRTRFSEQVEIVPTRTVLAAWTPD